MLFRYVAGSSIKNILDIKYFKNNTIPIINYISEYNNNTKVNKTYNEYDNLINNLNYNYMIALKLSSFNFNNNLINNIINKSINKNIPVVIDAEEDKNIEIYRNITNNLIQKYNKENTNIIKTYQMYRKDSLYELDYDFKYFNNLNINHSCKIVRGAYYNQEKNGDHLFKIKKHTDDNYNSAIIKCNEYNNNFHILATHNKFSLELGLLLSKFKNNLILANLMGMNEKYMSTITNIQKAKYIPYGPYREMIPYLTRRFYENIDQIKYMNK